MASWTDGAAYAPLERPDGFATPEADALEVAAPQLAQTPGPIPPPQGFQPSAPQAPLDQIRTDPPATRDPSAPFTTATATLTAGPEQTQMGGRDPRAPFQSYSTGVGSQELPPPSGAPLPAPMGAPLALSELPPPGSWPAPGGQMPPPGQFGAPGPAPLNAETLKTLRTLLILAIVGLGIGLLVPGTTPWLVLATGLLGLRTKPLTGHMGASACCAGIALLLFGLAMPDVPRLLGAIVAIGFIIWAAYGLRKDPSPRR